MIATLVLALGQILPGFARAETPDPVVSALFTMQSQANLSALASLAEQPGLTRAARHRQVVTALLQAAQQGDAFQAELDRRANQGELVAQRRYWIQNLFFVRARRSVIERLATRYDVAAAELDPAIDPSSLPTPPATDVPERSVSDRRTSAASFPPPNLVRGASVGIRAIRAPEVWTRIGVRGDGALIGSLDTGVDGSHPAFSSQWRGLHGHPFAQCWRDGAGYGSQSPIDLLGPGTRAMGVMLGYAGNEGDSLGVAPGAMWIASNAAATQGGPFFESRLISSLQWFLDPDGNPNTADDAPDVILNGWKLQTGVGPSPGCAPAWWSAVEALETAGIVMIFSTGDGGPAPGTVQAPADRASSPWDAFSVGAVDASSLSWPYPLTSFSGRGPTSCVSVEPLSIKPELTAPGLHVRTSQLEGAITDENQGTSLAAAHVAGVVALIRSANADLSTRQVKEILFDTCRDLGPEGDDDGFGMGFVDAYEGVRRAFLGSGTLEGQVRSAYYPSRIVSGATVTLFEIDKQFRSNPNGHYGGRATAGHYRAYVEHPDYSTLIDTLDLVTNQVVIADFSLQDGVGPAFDEIDHPAWIDEADTASTVAVDIEAHDASDIAWMRVTCRLDGGAWQTLNVSAHGGTSYETWLPATAHDLLEFYLTASDVPGNPSRSPAGAPVVVYRIATVRQTGGTAGPHGDPDLSLDVRPSPARPGAVIASRLPADATLRLRLFDLLGRELRTLSEGRGHRGTFETRWDGLDQYGRPLPAGVYRLRLELGPRKVDRTLLFLP